MLNKAQQALQNKNYVEARELYQAALRNGEDQGLANEGLCVSNYYLHEYQAAEKHALAAVSASPNLHKSHLILAYVASRRGARADSLSEIRTALGIAPSDPEALAFAGGLFLAQNNIDEAGQVLRKAQSLGYDDWVLHYNLGSLLLREGNYSGSSREYWKSFRLKRSWSTLRRWSAVNAYRFPLLFAALITITMLAAFYLRMALLLFVATAPLVMGGLWLAIRKEKKGVLIFLLGLSVVLGFFFLTK